jgi:phenylpropionate dioxygenase-like ring-hydroxylating dioxygenase large terminal subunit
MRLDPEILARAREPLGKAGTLPADAYTSPDVYAEEVARIFSRSWLCAGRVDQIPEPGDYLTLDLLDDRLVVVRGADRRARVLSRVCRHRGAELVNGCGNTRSFQCPYHAWTYGLDGRLIGTPLMDGAEDFERARFGLPELRSEVWEGWIFVNFDAGAPPLGPQLAPLSELLAGYRMEDMVAAPPLVFDSPFNWKVLVDNFMEAYHHIAIHRDTLQPIFPADRSHAPDNHGPYSALFMPARGDAPGIAAPDFPRASSLAGDEAHQLVAALVYPFHLFAPGADMLSWYQLLPSRHDRFELRIHPCFAREALANEAHAGAREGMRAVLDAVHQQDIGACEATWAGLQARSYQAGRLAPLEKPLWQFNQWWIERMAL